MYLEGQFFKETEKITQVKLKGDEIVTKTILYNFCVSVSFLAFRSHFGLKKVCEDFVEPN